jgi:hypothetical protein
LLHNQESKVDPDTFLPIPRNQWKSLQLIRVNGLSFSLNQWKKTHCTFNYYGVSYSLKVTEPVIIDKIKNGNSVSRKCLLTISLATPYKTPAYDKEYCWKMVAGVIEL